MDSSPRARIWTVTLGLLAATALAVWVFLATGAPAPFVGAGVALLAIVAVTSWRSGARFEADALDGRPLAPRDPPAFRRELLAVCEESGRSVPEVLLVEMDVPGIMVGYDDGDPTICVDPRVLWVVGSDGLRALYAHELGHLGVDIGTDAVRQYLPQTLGFTAFWLVVLAGRGPAAATAGTVLYLGLAPVSHRLAFGVRGLLSLGVEPLALAASRYANRQEEFLADRSAAEHVSPRELSEALYRLAAVATGDNDEDVAGPVPWEADRSLLFSVFATHPSIERRTAALGCDLPEWVLRYRPDRGSATPDAAGLERAG